MKNYVAAYRTMFHIKQSELAEMIDVTPSTLSFKETGKRDWTGSEMVRIWDIFKKDKPDIRIEDIFFNQ